MNNRKNIIYAIFISLILGVSSWFIFHSPAMGFVHRKEGQHLPSTWDSSKTVISPEYFQRFPKNMIQPEIYYIDEFQVKKVHLEYGLRHFIKKYKKKHLDLDYEDELIRAFFFCLEKDSNAELMLYFAALCSVESNYDQYVPRKYGTGIAQVVYSVHKDYIKELGVSKENFVNSAFHNIYVGYKIYWCYWKNSGYKYLRASTRYNGNATKGYSAKVDKRFKELRSLVHKAIKQDKYASKS